MQYQTGTIITDDGRVLSVEQLETLLDHDEVLREEFIEWFEPIIEQLHGFTQEIKRLLQPTLEAPAACSEGDGNER